MSLIPAEHNPGTICIICPQSWLRSAGPLHSSGCGKVNALISILNNSDTNMFSRCFPLKCSESPELRVSLLYLIIIFLTLESISLQSRDRL